MFTFFQSLSNYLIDLIPILTLPYFSVRFMQTYRTPLLRTHYLNEPIACEIYDLPLLVSKNADIRKFASPKKLSFCIFLEIIPFYLLQQFLSVDRTVDERGKYRYSPEETGKFCLWLSSEMYQ